MTSGFQRPLAVLALSFILVAGASPAAAQVLPNPEIHLTGTERHEADGKTYVRYKYDVTNKTAYPAAMFALSPALPPCGHNTNASRTWVDFFDSNDRRIYGFCALEAPARLDSIWFALEEGVPPPSGVYVTLTDRLTHTIYKSNLAATSP